ncbi:uncharacterized protein LOC135469052 [Liolophura sinensis]|uniref:uncharacterized protein LOC135469052 n=1 Tax=Liolophura sinensis TaxID=3198878 RepID=UPI0031584030
MAGEAECSYEGFYQFRCRTNEQETLVRFFQEHGNETGFQSAQSFISIGAGDGHLDSELIRNSLPELASYTGIECGHQMYGHLCATLQRRHDERRDSLSTLDVRLVNSTVGEYPGPDGPVDVVFMMHLLYYFGDERCSVIQKAMDWLKPRGRLVIGVVNKGNILQKLANVGKTNLVSWVEKIATNLQTLGLGYTEYEVVHEFRPAGCDRRFAEFVLRRAPVIDAEADEIFNFLPTQYEPGTTHIKHGTHVFVIQKEKCR